MRRKLISSIFCISILTTAHAGFADNLKPLFNKNTAVSPDRAVLYFDSGNRFNLKLMEDFKKECSARVKVVCIAAESSTATDGDIAELFKNEANNNMIYRGTTIQAVPRIDFIKNNEIIGSIEQDGNFTTRTGLYLDFLAGTYNKAVLDDKLAADDSAELYKKMMPRMNFVLKLAKKGQLDMAFKEMESIDPSKLDDNGRLLFGMTYLRLKAPNKALEVFSQCKDIDCVMYKGIAQYLIGDNKGALDTLKSIKSVYKKQNMLNYYLKKIYEADGDTKHAQEIRLPDNYSIDSE